MTTPEYRGLAYTVKQQGAPLCNSAWVRYESAECICIELDLTSKYCDLAASTGHGVMLDATKRSLHLSDEHPRESMTWVDFDLPPGKWNFFSGGVSRYTLSCVFLKGTV